MSAIRIRYRDRRSWPELIEKLNRQPDATLRVEMGSPGSAQATRCRLLHQWHGLEAWTEADVLYVRLRGRSAA